MKEYGNILQNPIRLSNSNSAITMLQNIITKNGFHIFYHFVDYIVKDDSIIEIYEVFSEDKALQKLFFEVTNDNNIWIPPTGFIFKDEFIIDTDIVYHGLNYFYKVEEDYERVANKFNYMGKTYFELFVFENVGVNYKSPDFPYSMYQKYIDEHTYNEGE